jgi:predicted RNA-binding protein with PIN domain
VKFLIDGYNLMHAVGLAKRAMPAAKFERARTKLLDWLADSMKDRAEVRVVFDAQQAPARSPESIHRGVRVRFAFSQTADDLIEELIVAEPKSAALTVVSNDSRVKEAARRGGCVTFSCEEFVDWLLSGEPGALCPRPTSQGHKAPGSPSKEKPEPTSRDVDELLRIFSTPKRKR